MASVKDAIVTVHGTFASATSDTGSEWWQKGSVFTEELKGYWPQGRTVEIHPLNWSGKNIDDDRYLAAMKLRKLLARLLRKYSNVFVIGHSHAGNIISSAIQSQDSRLHTISGGINGKGSERRLTFLTVGTPFLSTESVTKAKWRKAFIRLNILLFILLFGALLVYPEVVGNLLDSALNIFEINFRPEFSFLAFSEHSPTFAAFVYDLLIFAVFWLPIGISVLIKQLRSLRIADPEFIARHRFITIHDQADEAIGLFQKFMLPGFQIVPELMAATLIVYVLALIFGVGLLGYGLITGEFKQFVMQQVWGPSSIWWEGPFESLRLYLESLGSVFSWLASMFTETPDLKNLLLVVLLMAFVVTLLFPSMLVGIWAYHVVFRGIVRGIIRGLAYVLSLSRLTDKAGPISLGRIGARLLDRLIWQSLRSRSFGVDVSKTRINQVLRNWRTVSWRPLSQPIHKLLAAHCEPHIIAAWSKLRSVLLVTDASIPVRGSDETEMFTSLEFELLKHILTGPGWIHNSYFEIRIIRKLIYYALQERSGIGTSTALKDEAEFKRVCEAYEAIRPQEEIEQSVSRS